MYVIIVAKLFQKKEHQNMHIESIHEGKKPFKCNECGKAFSCKGNLNGHIEKVHEEKTTSNNVLPK